MHRVCSADAERYAYVYGLAVYGGGGVCLHPSRAGSAPRAWGSSEGRMVHLILPDLL